MFMPAIRAIFLPLALLVTRVLADHQNGAAAPDYLALLAHGLDRGSDLHRSVIQTYLEEPAQDPGIGLAPTANISRETRAQAALRAACWCQGVRIRGPSAVMATVCSKWAARDPSREYTAQLSAPIRTSSVPALTIGS